MGAIIIDGNKVAEEMRAGLKAEIELLAKKYGQAPGLAAVLVGDNPASQVYVRMKRKACTEVGIYSQEHRLPEKTSQEDLLKLIDQLNGDDKIHGILVQLPLPSHIDESSVLSTISPSKDVDCFHPLNVGKMFLGEPAFLPCTPHGVQQLLIKSGIEIEGKHVVIVGRSNIVGKPLAAILMQKAIGANATVTICHSKTPGLSAFTRQADIVVAAMGRARSIKADMVRRGAVVVDVGVNRVDDPDSKSGYRLVGDVDFDEVSQVADAITPVPGGVGPMTITMLLHNTVKSFKMGKTT